MAEPVKPVETTQTDHHQASSRTAAETLSLGVDMLSQNAGFLRKAKQMRSLAQLSDALVKAG